jgi:hypothetical protein
MENKGDGKPFQNLLFLIRDWEYVEDHAFGYEGGNKYLNEAVFKIKPNHKENMKQLRKYINDSFDDIQAFLMPHPGRAVSGSKKFDGSWASIDNEFMEQLKILVPSMLEPQHLAVKKIAGKEVTGEEFHSFMQSYLKLFSSSDFPSAGSVYESTVTKFLENLVSKCVVMYKELIMNGTSAVETYNDFNNLHLASEKKTIDFYNNEKKIGSNDSIISYRNTLIGDIKETLNQQNQTISTIIERKKMEREIEEERIRVRQALQKLEEDKEEIAKMQRRIEEAEAKRKAMQRALDEERWRHECERKKPGRIAAAVFSLGISTIWVKIDC